MINNNNNGNNNKTTTITIHPNIKPAGLLQVESLHLGVEFFLIIFSLWVSMLYRNTLICFIHLQKHSHNYNKSIKSTVIHIYVTVSSIYKSVPMYNFSSWGQTMSTCLIPWSQRNTMNASRKSIRTVPV